MINLSFPISFRSYPSWTVLGSQFCLLTAGILAPWIAIAALPIFRFGVWIDVEPTLVSFHWISALFAAGLFLDSSKSHKTFITPVICGIYLLIIGSLCMIPFSLDFDLTWYGLPDSGQGILSFIGFSFMLLGFKRLLEEGYSNLLLANVLLACLIISGFTFLGNFWGKGSPLADWSPYVYSAFLSFMAIGLLSLSLTTESQKYRLGGSILSGAIIILSSNKTAIVSLIALFCIIGSKAISSYLHKSPRFRFSLLVGLAPLAILLSMGLFSGPNHFPSIWSRVRIIQMVELEFLEHPWRLLTGYGWGSYTDTFLANLTRIPEALFQNGAWNPTWDGLSHINSHSHHQIIEALLSIGILGALTVLLLPAIAVYISDRDKHIPAFIVFFLYASISSGWFEIPATLPYIALSYAVFWPHQASWNKSVSSSLLIPWYGAGVILCIIGGIQTFNVGITYPGPSSLINNHFGDLQPITCKRALAASGPGGAHLAHQIRRLTNESAYYRYTSKQIIEEISQYACAAQSIKNPTLLLTLSLIVLTGDLAKVDTLRWVKPLQNQLLPQWRSRLERFLAKAPYRTDILAPYFHWQIRQGNEKEVWRWCNEILAKNPQDPTALWFKGKLLQNVPTQAAYSNSFLKQALSHGVSRILPIDTKLIDHIENTVK